MYLLQQVNWIFAKFELNFFVLSANTHKILKISFLDLRNVLVQNVSLLTYYFLLHQIQLEIR